MTVTSFQTVLPTGIAYGQIDGDQIVEENRQQDIPVSESSITDTELIVRSYFKDDPVMIQIARCESGFRHTLTDGSVLQGRVDPADTGVMQINKRYHEKTAASMQLDLDNIYDNMAYAQYLYDTQGTRPWSASAPCWNGHVAMNI
ncbi:MAG: hypothetical protein H6779_00410 [Candidatus Nomurabacteria bacterium]|nr:MAG: hypothetical protein H6779_00410 [Candidatus Nomurabacteria bacterium]